MPRPSDTHLEHRLADLAPPADPPEGFLARVRARRRTVVARRVAAAAVIALVCAGGLFAVRPRAASVHPTGQDRLAREGGPRADPRVGVEPRRAETSLVGMRHAWEAEGADWLATLDRPAEPTLPARPLRIGDSARILIEGL